MKPAFPFAAGCLCIAALLSVSNPAALAQPPESAALWERLTEPDVAAALELTDEQKSSVSTIITERDTALADAEESAKAAIRSAAHEKLQAVLTEEQQQKAQQLFGTPRLRFNFRAQKWEVVLKYFAEEAGLELVMDEPPPGTFNVDSKRDYTPTEAIDLLNRWLHTKGFTLVRNGNLLMCVNLKDGIPDGTLPRITPDELDQHGRAEFLSMLIPLEGRPPAETLKEIQPFVGTYGNAEALEKTGQLLVSASATSLREILRIVEQVPVPTTPPKKPAPPPPPKPVLEIYAIEHANPEQAGEVLKSLISGSLFVDADARQVSVNAIPTEQDKARAIIDQLEANQGPDQQPVLRVHPLQTDSPDDLIDTLKLATPSAQFRYDAATEKLIVWANEVDHGIIVRSIRDLEAVRFAESTRLQVYPLHDVTPDVAKELITTVLPKARVTVDPRTSSLIAVGTLSDHQAIAALLEQLQPRSAEVKPAGVQPYPIDPQLSETAIAIIKSIVPDAEITPDPEHDRLLIVAPAAKHPVITETLKQLADNLNTRERQLKPYDARELDVASVTALLTKLAPDAEVTSDVTNKRLLVVASAEDHATVASVIEQLADNLNTDEPALKSYPLGEDVNATTVTSLLTQLIPDIAITDDSEGRRLLITATLKDHAAIARTIAQFEQDARGELPDLQYLPLKKADGDNAVSVLKTMFPKATIQFEKDAKRLSVIATAEQLRGIHEVLGKLEAATPENERRRLKVYSVTQQQNARFTAVLESLTSEMRGLQMLTGAEPGELTLWARPSELDIIDGLLEQLQRDVPANLQRTLYVLPITQVDPLSVSEVLTELFPNASIKVDEEASRLLIRANPADYEAIKAAVEQLDATVEGPREIKVSVYSVKGIDPTGAQSLIEQQVPKVSIVRDATAETFIVVGRAKDHEKVAGLLETLRSSSAVLENRFLKVYPSWHSDINQEREFFSKAFPDAHIVIDTPSKKMTVIASVEDHERIAAMIEELKAANTEYEESDAVSYDIPDINAEELRRLLDQAAPDARKVITPNRLVVWAQPEDHDIVKRVVDGLLSEHSDKSVTAFDVKAVGIATARSILQDVAPDTTFLDSADGHSLIATVDEDTKTRIETTLAGLADSPAAASERSFRFYAVPPETLTDTRAVLIQAVPDVEFIASEDSTRLIALVDDDKHATIESALQKLAAENPFGKDREVRFYDVARAGPSASAVLGRMIPGATISSGSQPDQLIVEATAAEHLKVDQLLTQLKTAARDDSRNLQFYPVDVDARENTVRVLATTVPGVEFDSSEDGTRLIALVTDLEHDRTQKTLERLANEKPFRAERTLRFYDVGEAGTDVISVLQRLVTTATVSAASRPDQLMVEATDREHLEIEQLITQLKTAASDDGRRLEFYAVDRDMTADAQAVITSTVEDVTPTVSSDGSRLIVLATPEQHIHIQTALERLATSTDNTPARTLSVHDISGTDPVAIQSVLQPLMDSDVQVTVDPTGRRLYVRASEEQHDDIRKTIEQVMAGLSPDGSRDSRPYFVGNGNGNQARDALQAMYPDATIVTDRNASMIVATATDKQHELIQRVAEQMAGEGTLGNVTYPTVYHSDKVNGEELLTMIGNLFPADRRGTEHNVRLSVNQKTGAVVAVAMKPQHEIITQLIDQIDGDTGEEVQQKLAIYRVAPMRADVVQRALEPLVDENVTLSAERNGEELFVSAPAEEQQKIAELVEQIKANRLTRDGSEARTYRLPPYEANEAAEVLSALFEDATFVTNRARDIMVATATTEQHATIDQIVRQIRGDSDDEGGPVPRSYALRLADGKATLQILEDMFDRTDDVRLTVDERNKAILAVARPEQHRTIKAMLAELDPEDGAGARTLKEYSLFGRNSGSIVHVMNGLMKEHDPGATVAFQNETQVLMLTTTEEGHEIAARTIKRFPPLEHQHSEVFQLSYLDPHAARHAIDLLITHNILDHQNRPQIHVDDDSQQLWVRAHQKHLDEMRTLLVRMGEVNLGESGELAASTANMRVIPVGNDVDGAIQRIRDLTKQLGRNPVRVLTPGGDDDVEDKPSIPGQFSVPAEDPEALKNDDPAADVETPEAEAKADKASPIIVIPGEGRITIASEDTEALDQLESVLRKIYARNPRGRNQDFSIYQLRNAGASDVATTLDDIFEQSEGLTSFGTVLLVPENRLNALIVYGNRKDRERIEQLLEILDSEQVQDTRRAYQTKVVPVKHGDARRMETILEGIYAAQLRTGGTQSTIEIPKGVPPEVATVLRQINAAASSPLLTLEVQHDTNALIVKAPRSLLEEVEQLVADLDQSSVDNRSRSIRLLQLRKTSSARVMDVLADVLD